MSKKSRGEARPGRRGAYAAGGPVEGADLEPYLRGAVRLLTLSDGLVVPQRFTEKQAAYLDSEGRSRRARATAGIVIDLLTTGDEVSFECEVLRQLDPREGSYGEVMSLAPAGARAEDGVVDGIDVLVGDSARYSLVPRDATLRLEFENPWRREVEVRIYLPVVMVVAIGSLATNGSLRPAPRRGSLLALGDSITQGFFVGHPSASYPAQLARALGLDLCNQGIAGHVFDENTLRGMGSLRKRPPEAIVVAYGVNDWSHGASDEELRSNAAAYLDRLARKFPRVPTYVLTPLWRADEQDKLETTACGRPLSGVHELIAEAAAPHPWMHVVRGYDILPHDRSVLGDGRVHPNAAGATLVARRLLEEMGVDARLDDGFDEGAHEADAEPRAVGEGEAGDVRAEAERAADEQAVETGLVGKDTLAAEDGLAEQDAQAAEDGLAEQDAQAAEDGLVGEDGPAEDETTGAFPAAKTPAQSLPDAVDAETRARAGAPGDHPAFDRLVRTIWRLRQPDGCPWDKVQTHESITRNMIEEAYEAVDAIHEGSEAHLREELGDVLEQVLLHSQIAADEGAFDVDDVCHDLNEKLVRRHPHVFGDAAAATEGQALDAWDEVKREERAQAPGDVGLLDSVPRSLPALMQCQKVSKRAAKAGFEWASEDDVWRQVASEREEMLAERPGSEERALEFGDMLFALVNVARWEGIDAEAALDASVRKFRRRWARMEAMAREQGRELDSIATDELNALWDEAKREERAGD